MVTILTAGAGAIIVMVAVVGILVGTDASGHPSAPTSPPAVIRATHSAPTKSADTGPLVPATTTTTLSPTQATAIATLDAQLAPILAGIPSCVEVTGPGGVVYAANPATPLAPASTQKLLVALAALETLGPDYRFVTKVVGDAAPVGGQVANLWLVGGGDPLLATSPFAAWWLGQARYAGDPMTDINALVPLVKAAGVTTVPGGVHADESRYDTMRAIPTWPLAATADHDANPLSALTLNEGYQDWPVTPAKPAVAAAPGKVAAPAVAAVPGLNAADPAGYAAATLSALLGPAGVHAPPAPDSKAPVDGVVLAQVASAPLSAIIGAMLRPSDNQVAELMVKEIGFHHDGLGTTAGGLAVVAATDAALGVPLTGVLMRDGSGLDHGDRSTCQTLLSVLSIGTQPAFGAIPAGLAVAGQTGTLTYRFRGTAAAGKLRAKSGSTDESGGLVGFLDIGSGLRFAMLFDDHQSDAVLFAHEDAVVASLVAYATAAT